MQSSCLYPPCLSLSVLERCSLPLACSYVSWNHWERKTSQSPAAVLLCALMSHRLMWLWCTCECDRKDRQILIVCVRERGREKKHDNIKVNVTVFSYKNYLYRQELCDKGEEDHLLTIPHLLAIDFNPTPQFPPLATILHKDLWRYLIDTEKSINKRLKWYLNQYNNNNNILKVLLYFNS